ncbi:GLYR1-like protein, partial [Mya arenaria]
AWIPFETVYPYIGNKEKFLLTTRIPRGFKEAIDAIEDAIKNMPEEDRVKAEELPSIDEELAQIFSDTADSEVSFKAMADYQQRMSRPDPVPEELNNSVESADSDSPDKPKRKKRSRESDRGKVRPVKSLTPSEKILKRAKMTASSSPSQNIFSSFSAKKSPGKIRERKLPELRVSESDLSYDPSLGAPGMPLSSGSLASEAGGTPSQVKSVIPTPMRIGFLGLGIMGQGMVMNLLRSGHEVTVWNRTAQ